MLRWIRLIHIGINPSRDVAVYRDVEVDVANIVLPSELGTFELIKSSI